jgi:hypothetical protein
MPKVGQQATETSVKKATTGRRLNCFLEIVVNHLQTPLRTATLYLKVKGEGGATSCFAWGVIPYDDVSRLDSLGELHLPIIFRSAPYQTNEEHEKMTRMLMERTASGKGIEGIDPKN